MHNLRRVRHLAQRVVHVARGERVHEVIYAFAFEWAADWRRHMDVLVTQSISLQKKPVCRCISCALRAADSVQCITATAAPARCSEQLLPRTALASA